MLSDVWHRRSLACADVSESSLVAIVLLPPWRCRVPPLFPSMEWKRVAMVVWWVKWEQDGRVYGGPSG